MPSAGTVLCILLSILVFISIIGWPSLTALLDGKKSPIKLWIYLTFGALSLQFPIWAIALHSYNGNQSPRGKRCLTLIFLSISAATICAFCSSGFLTTYMRSQDSRYLGITIYSLVLTAGELYFSMLVLFMSLLLFCDLYQTPTRAERITISIYTSLLTTLIAVCAVSVFQFILKDSILRLELLISLSGLVFFLLIWMAIISGLFGGMGESSSRWGKTAGIVYILVYTPIYGYWTIYAVKQIYLTITSHQDSNLSVMIFFTYVIIFCTLFPGFLACGMMGLGFVLGVVLTISYFICRLICPIYLNSVFVALTHSNNQIHDPTEDLSQPLQINLEEENFDPSKHGKSFVEEEVCSVCLDNFAAGQLVTYWPICKHVFHKECLSYWIKKNVTCPICKQYYPATMPMAGDQDLPLDDQISDYNYNE